MQVNLAREDRLCLLLAQRQIPPGREEEVRSLLSQPVRWDLILLRVQQHQVYPLLFRNLRDLDFPGEPAEIRSRLGALYRMNALRNSLLARELADLFGALHEAGIQAIPWKGLLLSESLYGDISLRVCADMDFLLPRQGLA